MQRLAEELQVANQDGELLFFKGPWQVEHCSVDDHISKSLQAEKIGFHGFKKNELGQKLCDYGNDSERKWGKNKYN